MINKNVKQIIVVCLGKSLVSTCYLCVYDMHQNCCPTHYSSESESEKHVYEYDDE